MAAVLLPCSLCFLLFHGLEPQQRMFLRTAESWRCVAQCGALLGLAGSGYNAALAFTSIPQAVMFVNVHPLLIIAWRLLRAKMVSLGEIGGVLLGALGMALVVDSTTEGPASAHQVLLRCPAARLGPRLLLSGRNTPPPPGGGGWV